MWDMTIPIHPLNWGHEKAETDVAIFETEFNKQEEESSDKIATFPLSYYLLK